jgi:hypothetical protein
VSAPAKPTEEESRSSTVTPSTPSDGSRKRKAGGLYDGEIRQPSQRMRTSTPENTSHRHVFISSCSSTSSLNSSVDSLDSFYTGAAAKDRNHSSDTSEMESFDTVFSAKGLIEGSTSFDDQINIQAKGLPSAIVKSEEDASASLLFSDTGRTQLDFDDLGIDLDSLVDNLPSFDMAELDFSMPQHSAVINRQRPRAHSDVNRTPRQPTFAVPEVPTSMFDAATALLEAPVSAEEELRRAKQIEEWAFGIGLVVEEEEDDELYLNLDGLRASPTNDSMSTSGSSSKVATPQDLFDFSFDGLCLDHVMNERLESFQEQGSEYETELFKKRHDLMIDIETANAYSTDDAMATARDNRHEILAN